MFSLLNLFLKSDFVFRQELLGRDVLGKPCCDVRTPELGASASRWGPSSLQWGSGDGFWVCFLSFQWVWAYWGCPQPLQGRLLPQTLVFSRVLLRFRIVWVFLCFFYCYTSVLRSAASACERRRARTPLKRLQQTGSAHPSTRPSPRSARRPRSLP